MISGCSTATPEASPTPGSSQPEPAQPDAENDSDSAQPSEAAMGEPDFSYSGHGQTLAVIQNIMDGPHRIMFVDPEGLGWREVPLPQDASIVFNADVALSPNGVYYAYYTGSTETGDLTLVIYNLADERVLTEMRLLSDNYPGNFQELADEMVNSGAVPPDLAVYGEANYAYELQGAFEYGIKTLAWSPQGRYLAFSGQMDGLSSDLYVLDMQTMDVERLTSGPGMMQRLSWSPDGEWIMHASANVIGAGTGVTNHAASRDGSQVVSFPANLGLQEGVWLTNNLYTVNDADNGPGEYDLMVLNVRDGSVTTIFEGAFFSYAFDPDTNTILLQSYPFFDSDPEQGLYRIEASAPFQLTRLSAPTITTLIHIGLDNYPFAGFLDGGGLVLINSDGSTRSVAELSWYPYPASTENLLALRYFPRNEGFWIYDLDQDQRIDITEESVFRLIWSPNSDSLFYVSNSELHVFRLGITDTLLLYTWPADSMSDIHFKWVTLP
jgi:WD40 repeat protein